LFQPEGGYERPEQDTQQRRDRTPLQFGLLSLGYVAHPTQLREDRHIIENVYMIELVTSLAAAEIRDRFTRTHWDRLTGYISGEFD